LLAIIPTTGSLKVKAKEVPVALLLTFKNEFASFAQVRTGAVVSGIVAVVDAEVVDMVPEIPF
jgi:hypothetical protein